MKNYNDIQKLNENFGTSDIRIRILSDDIILNEGVLGDFLRVAKDKYFSTNVNLPSDEYNKYRYAILETFLSSFDEFKFKTFSISNVFFKPKEILKDIKIKYIEILKREYEAAKSGGFQQTGSLSPVFKFKGKYGVSKVSLLADILETVDNLERLIKEKDYQDSLNRLYKVESLKYSTKKESYDTFLTQLKSNFFDMFDVTKQKYFRYGMGNKFLVKNKFQEYLFKVLKIFKKKNIDAEYIFANDELYKNIQPIVTKDEYEKDMSVKDKKIFNLDLSIGYINDILLAASRKLTGSYKYVADDPKQKEYFNDLLQRAILKYTKAKGEVPPNKETYTQILINEFNLENPDFKYEVKPVRSEVAAEKGKSTDTKVEPKKDVIEEVEMNTPPFNKNEIIYSVIEVITQDENYINDSNRDYFNRLYDLVIEEYKKEHTEWPPKNYIKKLFIDKFRDINPSFDLKTNNNLVDF